MPWFDNRLTITVLKTGIVDNAPSKPGVAGSSPAGGAIRLNSLGILASYGAMATSVVAAPKQVSSELRRRAGGASLRSGSGEGCPAEARRRTRGPGGLSFHRSTV